MIKVCTNIEDIIFILHNLRQEDVEELLALWGREWFDKILNSLLDKEVLVLYDFKSRPIAMGGFYEMPESSIKIACVWLLTTNLIKNNKVLLSKSLKAEIDKASKKYDILYNYIYVSNFEARRWLKKLGFCFDKPKPNGLLIKDGFDFFYKRKER